MSALHNHTTSTPLTPSSNCIVLYGLDENDKPRAARFDNLSSRELLAKAADSMGLQLCVPWPALAEIVARLPAGKLYSSGRGFVPNIRRSLYDQLIAALNDKRGTTSHGLPASWDDIDVGHLVIAYEGPGWWDAIVVEKNGDMLTLRWRDYPKQANVVQHRTSVALKIPRAPQTNG